MTATGLGGCKGSYISFHRHKLRVCRALPTSMDVIKSSNPNPNIKKQSFGGVGLLTAAGWSTAWKKSPFLGLMKY